MLAVMMLMWMQSAVMRGRLRNCAGRADGMWCDSHSVGTETLMWMSNKLMHETVSFRNSRFTWLPSIAHKSFHAGSRRCLISTSWYTLWLKKNAPTLVDYNYDPVQSILIIFSKLFVNDHKSCLVVKFSTSPHICCHYTLWNTMLYFALITLFIAKNAPTSDHHNFNKR